VIRARSLLALVVLASPAAAQELPRTHAPQPTTPAITPGDLMTRLYILADDSMMGREAGKRGNVKGTDYIAAEYRRMGLEPAGENGTFFQTVPMVEKGILPGASLTADGAALALRTDWVPFPEVGSAIRFVPRMRAQGVQAVFGGRVGGQMLAPEQARGKLVVLLPPLGEGGAVDYRFWSNPAMRWYPDAAGVAVVSLEASPGGLVGYLLQPQAAIARQGPAPAATGAPGMLVSAAAARRLLGADPATLAVGAAGRTVTGAFEFGEKPTEAPARNVVGVLRGSDPALRGQYATYVAAQLRAYRAGTRQTEVAGGAIQALGSSVNDAAQAALQIAASSQQQLVGVDQVAGAMESIKQASAQNVVSATQLETTARSLNDLGHRLKQMVERYKV